MPEKKKGDVCNGYLSYYRDWKGEGLQCVNCLTIYKRRFFGWKKNASRER